MIRVIKWSLLALLAYLVFLFAKLPANQLISRVDLPSNMQAQSVSGTIWDGSVGTLLINNVAVERVRWQLSFWQLLVGNIKLDLDAGNMRSAQEVAFRGPVTINLFDPKQVRANDFTVYVPASVILAQLTLPVSADATGRLKVKVDELDYPNQCVTLSGQGQWINAGLESIQGLSEPLDLGNFDAQLSCIDNDILVSIREPNIFGLNADARIPSSMKISLDARFKPSNELPNQVLEAARFFGRTDADGYYKFKL